MKIAVTGKGGVGKTTFAATLARLYAEEGRHVMAADVDPDANLGLALGFSEEELDSCYATLAKVFRNAEAINELVTGPDESWRREVAANPGDDWDCRHRKEKETS